MPNRKNKHFDMPHRKEKILVPTPRLTKDDLEWIMIAKQAHKDGIWKEFLAKFKEDFGQEFPFKAMIDFGHGESK